MTKIPTPRITASGFEFFNLLNRTNVSNPVTNFRSAIFEQIQSNSDPRIIQFAAKFAF